jgi:hypothetical protein
LLAIAVFVAGLGEFLGWPVSMCSDAIETKSEKEK